MICGELGADGAQRHEAVIGRQLRELMLVRVTDDERDAIERGNLLGSALGVASSDEDAGRWIGAVDATNGRAGVLVSGAGDGTCVQHDHVGIGRGGSADKSTLTELTLNCCAIGLGGSTAEIFHVVTGHMNIIEVARPAGSQRRAAEPGAGVMGA